MTVMLCNREGNRGSSHVSEVVYPPTGSTGTETEMSTPPMLHTGAWSTLPLLLYVDETKNGSLNLPSISGSSHFRAIGFHFCAVRVSAYNHIRKIEVKSLDAHINGFQLIEPVTGSSVYLVSVYFLCTTLIRCTRRVVAIKTTLQRTSVVRVNSLSQARSVETRLHSATCSDSIIATDIWPRLQVF